MRLIFLFATPLQENYSVHPFSTRFYYNLAILNSLNYHYKSDLFKLNQDHAGVKKSIILI